MSKKKFFVVSDIHGYYTEFVDALNKSGFVADSKNQVLIICGDLFDRGSENFKVLQYVEKLNNKILLRGNHEDMLLDIIYSRKIKPHNYINGTIETLTEFFGKYSIDYFNQIDLTGKSRMVDRICDLFSEMKNYYETRNYIFVHGWLPVTEVKGTYRVLNNWRKATDEQWKNARWIKWTEVYNKFETIDKTIVCGHVPSFYANNFDENRQKNDSSIFYGNKMIAIDGGTYSSGLVNVFSVEDEIL